MARSRRTTALELLVDLLARYPWWVGVLVGLAAWFIFGAIASSPLPTANALQPSDMSRLLIGQTLRTFAMAAQYFIPFACLIGAIVSIVGRAKRKKLLVDVKAATQPGKTIDGLTWQQFEQLIGEAFRMQGYSITETGGKGADGGVDLILRKGGEKYLVQCKHWRALKVGVPVIREFFGAMAVEGAAGGFVVTSGQFTSEAEAFAEGRNIKLVDGAALKRWLGLVQGQSPSPASPAFTLPSSDITLSAEPSCPVCRSAMVKRTAKRGPNAGNLFYGCVQYPRCRGVVNL
ncbi:restriction endonuclease [Pseudomonas sp.]|uniref:restriction endonuclease n=1 Tax=Pseudomonas sp. TaxID=306 RepID=UPI00272C77FB|nr:restriction endonuclease [Pseudomonas sp.]